MKIKQFVMAYSANHSSIKALLNDKFESLRPVLRINVEVITDDLENSYIRIELNTPVAANGKRGWLNLKVWESPTTEIIYNILDNDSIKKARDTENKVKGSTSVFSTDFLTIEYKSTGVVGGCPAENDNDGCFYLEGDKITFINSEKIDAFKEYSNCTFEWKKPIMTAMQIPTEKILGAYLVEFDRVKN